MLDINAILAGSSAPAPTPLLSPQEAMAKSLSLQQMQQQSQMGQLQYQQAQQQFNQQQALNNAYKQALTPGDPTTGTSADIDSGKLSNALAASGAGSLIPGVLKGVTEFKQATANLAKTQGDVAAQQADAAGSLGAAVQKANYDPRLFLTLGQHAIDAKAVAPNLLAPTMSKVVQALQQDPSGASANAIVKQVSDTLVAQSPAQQKLANEARTAQGAADRGAAALTDAGVNVDKWNTAKPGAQLQAAAQQLAAAKTQQAYSQIWAQLPAGVAQNFDTPDKWNAQTTPANALRAGLTPDQQVTTNQTATRDANTAAFQQNEMRNSNARNAREQANFNASSAAGTDGKPLPGSPAYMVAHYQIPPPSARSIATPQGQAFMAQVGKENPDYDGSQFGTIATARKAFTSGTQGQTAVALNTAIGHADLAYQMGQALKNGTFTPGNALYNQVTSTFGAAAVNNYRLVTTMVAGEAAKAAAGQRATEGEQNTLKSLYSSNASPDQMTGALGTTIQILGSKAKALNDSYRQAVGSTRAGDNFSVVTPESRQVLQSHGFDPDTLKPAAALPAGAIAVIAPDGSKHVFPNQAKADQFKKLAGIQ